MNSGLASIAFGIVAALTWGAGDFSGGFATKRTNAYSVVIAAHLFSLGLLVAAALILQEPFPKADVWLWGAAAGLGAGVGLPLLYRALAEGHMSVAAPVSALVAAGIPVALSAVTVELPPVWVSLGLALALAAIWLVSGGRADVRLFDLRLPILAGIAFSIFFLTLHRASGESILYPLIAVRLVSIPTLLAIARVSHQPVWPTRQALVPSLISGLMDTLGNAAYALSAQLGRVDIAVVLGSLYPGSTVLLAWLLLRERISRQQLIGIATALAAIVLITV
ncbi:MAG: DMT family transporter [Anaerolineales bacterium]